MFLQFTIIFLHLSATLSNDFQEDQELFAELTIISQEQSINLHHKPVKLIQNSKNDKIYSGDNEEPDEEDDADQQENKEKDNNKKKENINQQGEPKRIEKEDEEEEEQKIIVKRKSVSKGHDKNKKNEDEQSKSSNNKKGNSQAKNNDNDDDDQKEKEDNEDEDDEKNNKQRTKKNNSINTKVKIQKNYEQENDDEQNQENDQNQNNQDGEEGQETNDEQQDEGEAENKEQMDWEEIGDENEGEGQVQGENTNEEQSPDEIAEEQNFSEEKEVHNIKDLSDEELGRLVRDALKRKENKRSLEDDDKAINQKRVNTEQNVDDVCFYAFEECNYQGRAIKLCGRFPTIPPQLSRMTIRSIQIPRHTRIEFYSQSNYNGELQSFIGSNRCLINPFTINNLKGGVYAFF